MNSDFLIPFICLCVCISWGSCVKGLSERRHDYIPFYDTTFCSIITAIFIICIFIGVIIVGINAGFLIALAYIGVFIASFLINQLVIIHIILAIFGYSGIGALAPYICGIASAIWMFSQSGSVQ